MKFCLLLSFLAWGVVSHKEAMAVRFMLETVDADSGKPIPCLIRLKGLGETIKPFPTKFLIRGTGLPKNHPARQWLCFPGTGEIEKVTGNLTVEAFAGPEYEMAKKDISGNRVIIIIDDYLFDVTNYMKEKGKSLPPSI